MNDMETIYLAFGVILYVLVVFGTLTCCMREINKSSYINMNTRAHVTNV